jgi:hypothetical protein
MDIVYCILDTGYRILYWIFGIGNGWILLDTRYWILLGIGYWVLDAG